MPNLSASNLSVPPLAQLAPVVLGLSETERSSAMLCRVMTVTGFGGRRDGEAILVRGNAETVGAGGEFVVVGTLLGGSADSRLMDACAPGAVSILRLPIGDDEAVRAGLACGGIAEVLIEPVGDIPAEFWIALASRSRVGLASELPLDHSDAIGPGDADTSRRCLVVRESTVLDLPADVSLAVAEQLRKGTVRAQIIEADGFRVFCEIVSPLPHLAVIGVSGLADAMVRQAALLGWTTAVVDERTETGLADALGAASELGSADALVVLSHDLEASCGALHVAASKSLGSPYLGALGSRHTQGARAERLSQVHGWSAEQLATIHGPVGLDIGSRTPEETALAIAAEIVAHQRNRNSVSLSSIAGPINAP